MLSQLGPYLIDEELAQGGMARVFRARLRGLGGFEKTLVIKQIRPELAKDPRFVELFVREANTLVSLSHPHIVPVYELGAADGTYYLSMEYVEGATVLQMLAQGPLAPALVAHLGAQVCEALEYAHSRFGILHRDITPRNIIVDQAGHTRVVDFGIAASADVIDPVAFGSPGYMSPEQVEGKRVSPQSDLFSLGAVLFEALSGRPAFAKTERGSLGATPLSVTPLAADGAEAAPSVPEPLAELVLSMLAPAPEQRPRSAAEVARSLRAVLARTSPHGALEEMQRRVREARSEPTPKASVAAPLPSTARIEARAIATSPVLTEILRSSAFAPIPTKAAVLPSRAEPTPAEGSQETTTRPLRASVPDEAAAEHKPDRTDAKLTALMLRAWPLLALAALLAALLGRGGSPARDTPAPTRVESARSAATPAPLEPVNATRAPPRPADLPIASEAPHAVTVTPHDLPAGANASASVSVNARPWAEVKLDGRPVGTTPLRKLKLRPGVHTLALSCPPLGRATTLKLDFVPSQAARVVVDLTQSPARTSLDGVREAR